MSSPQKPPKLLDRVRATLRTNRYSPRTEQVYVEWIKRFIRFHGVRHPQEMGAEEVKAILSHLATQMNVAASTQNQAFQRSCSYIKRCSNSDYPGLTTSCGQNGPRKCR